MRHKRVLLTLVTVLLASFFLSGCKLVRELEVDNIDLNGAPSINVDGLVTVRVEDGKVLDEESILNFFYGENKETLLENGYITEYYYKEHRLGYECVKDKIQVNYTYGYNMEAGYSPNFFIMCDISEIYQYDGQYYSEELDYKDMDRHFLLSFAEKYPEIGTESDMGNEAITFCTPLVEACGYKDAQVKVYQLKSEYSYVPEACILVYQSLMNGLVLDTSNYKMLCIYVPEYKRVVYAIAEQSLVAVEALEEVEPVSKEQAVAEAVRVLSLSSSEGFTVLNMNLVYSPIYEKVSKDMVEGNRVIEPCWRIDYALSGQLLELDQFKDSHKGTIFINAVDGKVSK